MDSLGQIKTFQLVTSKALRKFFLSLYLRRRQRSDAVIRFCMRKSRACPQANLSLFLISCNQLFVDGAPAIEERPRLFGLRRGRPARVRRRRLHDVRILNIGRGLINGGVHLFRADDSVRLVQLFAQVVGGRRRAGSRRGVKRRSWVRRLSERWADDKGSAGDQQAKSCSNDPHPT